MIQVKNMSKQFGSKVLFENADVFIGDRARVALVGPNGAGKSTFIRMLLGMENPDSGQVTRSKNLQCGYLAQEVPSLGTGTVLSTVMKLGDRVDNLKKARADLENSFANGLEDPEALEEYGKVMTELERFDESTLEARAKTILMGMGFKVSDFDRNLSEFSGGWLMRVAFSHLLFLEPNLLLLDEPTNHLDLESILWLENFLRNYPGAILMISHDTAFLNSLVDEVVEIDQKKIYQYRGNLSAQEMQKSARLELLQAQYRQQQAKIDHLQDFIDRNRAKASKATQAQSRIKQIEKMDRIELPQEKSSIRFRFPPIPSGGKEVITLRNVCVLFGEKRIFDKIHLTIKKGDRIAIAGVNGAGKTTLLRTLSGHLEPSTGEVKLGYQIAIGYYAQHQSETLNLGKTILEELHDTAPHLDVSHVRGIAGAFLFTGDAVMKKCSVLSGGEKARVALAKLLLFPSNFLILDEPTNHLDKDSREVLLDALKAYPGTVCLVTHDRDFASPLVTSVLEIQPSKKANEPSQVVQLLGNYEDYLKRKLSEVESQQEDSTNLKAQSKINKDKSNDRALNPPEKQQPTKKQLEKQQMRLENEIIELESKRAEIDALLTQQNWSNNPETVALVRKRKEIEELLAVKEQEWEGTIS